MKYIENVHMTQNIHVASLTALSVSDWKCVGRHVIHDYCDVVNPDYIVYCFQSHAEAQLPGTLDPPAF